MREVTRSSSSAYNHALLLEEICGDLSMCSIIRLHCIDINGKTKFCFCGLQQVLKDYEAFERLQKEMLESFPHLKLPNLPRKYHFFMSDADIEERQIAFDCLLKV